MIEKFPPLSLAEGLHIWSDNYESSPDEVHLSSQALEELALPGALDSVDEEVLEHLSSCPVCLKKWSAICKKHTVAEDGVADDWYSGGMLEAAASERTGGPITMPSRCGNFEIRLLPDKGSDKKYMAVLEVISSRKTEFENSHISIHDSQGKMLLEGTVTGARLGRMVEDLDSFDLSHWSMIVRFATPPKRS
jgi:hypothetical protein